MSSLPPADLDFELTHLEQRIAQIREEKRQVAERERAEAEAAEKRRQEEEEEDRAATEAGR